MGKTLVFRAYTEYGKLDQEEWQLMFDVTDEEFELLKSNYKELTPMYEIDELIELTARVTSTAVEQATIDMIESGMADDYIEELLEEGDIDSEEEWTADMTFRIWVDWPYGF